MWGSDISAGPTGDLALVDGTQRGIERIVKRIMTRGKQFARINSPAKLGELIFHGKYGGSVPQRIGEIIDASLITAVIRAQIAKEGVAAKSPAPVITLDPFPNGVNVLIQYNDRVTGLQRNLKFDVNQ